MTLPPQNQLKKLPNNFARFLHVTHIKLVIPTSVNPAWGIISLKRTLLKNRNPVKSTFSEIPIFDISLKNTRI